MPSQPDSVQLASWLHSWIQPDGSIHGFHNHSVWGDNPYRYGDMTAGHSTFASPLAAALARAWIADPDPGGFELIARLMSFQSNSFQEDGQFRHIGFQVGEMLHRGLIHNVVPGVALATALLTLGNDVPPTLRSQVDAAIRRNLAACDLCYGAFPSHGKDGTQSSTSNQEYCRLWAQLAHMEAFHHGDWDDSVPAALHFMIEHFHVAGVPDAESSGSLRTGNDHRFLEPAEYYGLMIAPLVLGARRYGEPRFLEEAVRLARHIERSAWIDSAGQRRFHRLFLREGERWTPVREPMLIGGMGITLFAINQLLREYPDRGLEQLLDDCDRTYAHYQAPSGFFLAASGWSKEADIIPSSAWQSHDLLYLLDRHPPAPGFWDALRTPQSGLSVVLGENCIWLEDHQRWALQGYHSMSDANLAGRKDAPSFHRQIPDWIIPDSMPPKTTLVEPPVFQRLDQKIRYFQGRSDLRICNATRRPYEGPAEDLKQPLLA